MATIKKIRINPRRRKKTQAATKARKRTATPKRKRQNPPALLVVGNPKKGTSMQKKRKKAAAPKKRRRSNPNAKAAPQTRRKARRRNPIHFATKKRRRRNPSITGRASGLVRQGAFAFGGFVVTRQLPQMLLGARNTGWLGWAANLVTILLTSAAVSKFVSRNDGNNYAIGGSLYLFGRVLSETVNPIPKALSLSGFGDPQAATSGQLGAYRDKYMPTPVGYNRDGSIAFPRQLTAHIDDRVKAAAPPPASKMAGLRMMGRRIA